MEFVKQKLYKRIGIRVSSILIIWNFMALLFICFRIYIHLMKNRKTSLTSVFKNFTHSIFLRKSIPLQPNFFVHLSYLSSSASNALNLEKIFVCFCFYVNMSLQDVGDHGSPQPSSSLQYFSSLQLPRSDIHLYQLVT